MLRRTQAVRLTDNQRVKLEWIAATSPHLYRAYLLKEGLRFVFRVEGEEGQQDPFLLQVGRTDQLLAIG
ncbi:transposase [Nocardioides sp. J2M5]|uniref:transposase n=1 Tax=Nocardioides palaemonis TaxID=2829810 RepID=UPI001BACEEB4|nr:transposase [Nocardioides palaemonis]